MKNNPEDEYEIERVDDSGLSTPLKVEKVNLEDSMAPKD
jgi:hypothetical protein